MSSHHEFGWSMQSADAATFYTDEHTQAINVRLKVGEKSVPAILHIIPKSGYALVYCDKKSLPALRFNILAAIAKPTKDTLYRVNKEAQIAARQNDGTLFLYNTPEPGISTYPEFACSGTSHTFAKEKIAKEFACRLRRVGISMLPSIKNT